MCKKEIFYQMRKYILYLFYYNLNPLRTEFNFKNYFSMFWRKIINHFKRIVKELNCRMI